MIEDFVTVEWAPNDDPLETSPTWEDITGVVMSVDTGGGRAGVFDLYGQRTATIVCRNGRLSPVEAPTFEIGTFYRWIQVRVMSGADAVFTGYITRVEHQSHAPHYGTATVSCVDKMGILAYADLATGVFGTTINSLTLVGTVTEAAEFALAAALIDTTVTVVGGSTMLVKSSGEPGNGLQWLQSVMEAECGGFQVAADGTATITGRWLPFTVAADATPTLTFSDTPAVGEFRYLREDLTFASHDEDYYNRAVTKSEYWPAVFDVGDGGGSLPTETLSRTSLPVAYQSWAEANAAHLADLYSHTATYPRSLNVHVASSSTASTIIAALLQACDVLGAEHVVVEHTPTGVAQQTYHVTVENFTHSITPEQWKTSLGFGSLDRWIDTYGDTTDIFPLVLIGGDADHGIDSGIDAIIAP